MFVFFSSLNSRSVNRRLPFAFFWWCWIFAIFEDHLLDIFSN